MKLTLKTLVFIFPVLLVLAGCGSPATAAPDVAAQVSATLTAIAAASTPAVSPTTTLSLETPAAPSTSEPASEQLPLAQLQNATYTSADWGEFSLTNGVFYRTPPTTQESPEAYTTRLLDAIYYGDLNGDGVEDAVVFLATQNGGTGHFVEMAGMLNIAGKASNAASIFLGDRVVVEGGAIQHGIISLQMRVHSPNDGMCCPSQSALWKYQLVNGEWVQIP